MICQLLGLRYQRYTIVSRNKAESTDFTAAHGSLLTVHYPADDCQNGIAKFLEK